MSKATKPKVGPRRAKLEVDPELCTRFRGGHSQLLGYARVSRRDQSLNAQLHSLEKAGVCRVYMEKVSGASANRPALAALLEALRKGDVVVVVSLDRLGRKLSELVRTLDAVRESGAHLRDLRAGLDTSSPNGRMMLTMIGAFADAERELIRERTREGLRVAAAQGRRPGRPRLLVPAKVEQVEHLALKGYSVRAIATAVNLSESSVRNALDMVAIDDPRQLTLDGT